MAWQAIVAGATSAGGGAQGAIGGYQAAKAQIKGMQYQARLEGMRAGLLREQARAVEEQGESLVKRLVRTGETALDRGLGALAAGNVQLGVGSAAAFEVDTAALIAGDVEQQRTNVAMETWALTNEAALAEFSSDYIWKQSKQARRVAKLNLVGGLAMASGSGANAYAGAGGQMGPTSQRSTTGGGEVQSSVGEAD